MNGALCIGKKVANDVLSQINVPQVEDTFITTAMPYTVEGQKKLDYVLMKPTHIHWIELELMNDFLAVFEKITDWGVDVVKIVKYLIDELKKLLSKKELENNNGPISKFAKFLDTLSEGDTSSADYSFGGVKRHFK